MFSLFKTMVWAVVLAGAAYGVFFVPVGGATIAQHVEEVWRTDAVQKKVDRVRADVKDEIQERITEAAHAELDKHKKPHKDDLTAKDRKSLDDLIEKHAGDK